MTDIIFPPTNGGGIIYVRSISEIPSKPDPSIVYYIWDGIDASKAVRYEFSDGELQSDGVVETTIAELGDASASGCGAKRNVTDQNGAIVESDGVSWFLVSGAIPDSICLTYGIIKKQVPFNVMSSQYMYQYGNSTYSDYERLGTPLCKSGSYTPSAGGSGGAFVNVGFVPDFLLICSDATTLPVWRCNVNWYGRTDHFTNQLSKNLCIDFRDDGFVVTNNAKVGAAGTTYYYFAFKDNDSNLLKQTNLFGNGLVGRTVNWLSSQPASVWFKRDNANSMVCWAGSATNAASPYADGTGASAGVTSITNGVITLGANAEVNELNGPAGFGEGTNILAWYSDSANTYTSTYSGTGVTQNVTLPFTPEAVLIFNNAGTPKGQQWWFASLPSGKSLPVSATASALTTGGRITVSGTTVTVNTDTGVNASGSTYTIMAWKRNTDAGQSKFNNPAPVKRHAIDLSGSNSWIDCGTSDTLKIVGTGAFEWLGSVQWPNSPGQDVPLIVRANGDAAGPGTQGQVSWGMTAYQRVISDVYSPQSAVDYKGWALRVICSTFFDLYETGNSNPAATTNWDIRYSPFNTGLLVKEALRQHWMIVSLGLGVWRVYLNGEFVKDRNLNMTTLGAQNLNSPSGHRTVIGARAVNNGNSIINSARMRFELARVYNAALTDAQVKTRYKIAMLGYTGLTDVTTGLVEEWDAKNASGNKIIATVNPSINDGIISGGVKVEF